MKLKTLEILSQNLEKQKEFYGHILGLEIVKEGPKSISFKIGSSVLTLKESPNFTPYHFAINVPSNQEKEALHWLEERVEILKDGDSKIQFFDFWNAFAIYFYDADHNIVELIARKTLDKDSSLPFSQNSLLSISEIGLPTNDVAKEYHTLKAQTDIPIYSGSLERFCAVGDEEGLFIIINKNLKKDWYPTTDEPFSSDFNIQFIENDQEYSFEYKQETLTREK